jgi:hypothetical protein
MKTIRQYFVIALAALGLLFAFVPSDHAQTGTFKATYALVDDDAYASSWNGSTQVPTKNAVYDKIETISGGGLTITAGTYTPTLTNVTNIDSSTASQCQYLRVGNTVTVSGRVLVDATAGATATELDISLPVASNFSSDVNAGGTASATTDAGNSAGILADSANDRAQMAWIVSTNASTSYYFSFTYLVQ